MITISRESDVNILIENAEGIDLGGDSWSIWEAMKSEIFQNQNPIIAINNKNSLFELSFFSLFCYIKDRSVVYVHSPFLNKTKIYPEDNLYAVLDILKHGGILC